LKSSFFPKTKLNQAFTGLYRYQSGKVPSHLKSWCTMLP
jgi:hypothetical protein